tara:strand:- start:725 stop:952 length:228 start_codon:yes stop_codon:yes gene_type:complete
MTAETVDDILSSIVSIIAELSKDIKSNTGKKNIQTSQDNKVKLKEIAKKLKSIKTKLIELYQPKKTIQTTLDINE